MTSIAQERAKLAALGQSLRTRSQWGAVRSYTDSRAVTEPASHQFVHISVTNPGSFKTNDAHARAIEQIGISRFPATGISYNRGIAMDGTRYEFQPIGRRGAHTGAFKGNCPTPGCPNRGANLTASNWNVLGRGYVIMQNVNDAVSANQLDALARTMAADRLAGFVRRDARIHGHRCVSDKSCPGDKLWARITELNTLVKLYVARGFPTTPPEDDLPLNQTDLDNIYKVVTNAVGAHPDVFGNMTVGRDVDPNLPGKEKVAAIQELADAKTIALDIQRKVDAILLKLQEEAPPVP